MIWQTTAEYVQNTPEIAKKLAHQLRMGPVFFCWTDGRGTHMDVWMLPAKDVRFAWVSPDKIQRGLHMSMVMVSIERKGAFFFDLLSGTEEYHAGYLNEKLSWGDNPEHLGFTIEALAELFNMIIQAGNSGRNIIV